LKLIIISSSGLATDDRGDHTSDSPQRKFATDALQVRLHTHQRTGTHTRLNWPLGGHQGRLGGLALARQKGDQIQRSMIAPLEIFEHQDQYPGGRQRLDRRPELPHINSMAAKTTSQRSSRHGRFTPHAACMIEGS
jgi:hypothetical protein